MTDFRIVKYLSLLTSLSSVFLILGVSLQDRMITFGSIYVCGTVFVYPLTCFNLNIIAEIYGYKVAKQSLWISILGIFIFAAVLTIISKLSTPTFDLKYSEAFAIVVTPMFRTMFVGTVAILIGQHLNIYVISKLKFLMSGKYFAFRSVTSSFVGEVATALISLTGIFANQIEFKQILSLTLYELIIMFVFAFILAFPGAIIANILERVEPNCLDEKINFNPFSWGN